MRIVEAGHLFTKYTFAHFKIQMDDVERVEILESEADLDDKAHTVCLCQREILICDLDKQLSSVKILHHDDDGGGAGVAVHIPDDVLVAQTLQDGNLLGSQLSVGSPPCLDELGGKTFLRFHFPNKMHHSKPALAELIIKRLLQQSMLRIQNNQEEV